MSTFAQKKHRDVDIDHVVCPPKSRTCVSVPKTTTMIRQLEPVILENYITASSTIQSCLLTYIYTYIQLDKEFLSDGFLLAQALLDQLRPIYEDGKFHDLDDWG